VVTVGNNFISTTSLKKQRERKTLKFKSPDARPAGRGVAVQDRYYLPLTTGESGNAGLGSSWAQVPL